MSEPDSSTSDFSRKEVNRTIVRALWKYRGALLRP